MWGTLIEQHIEIIEEDQKWFRLLQILGEWCVVRFPARFFECLFRILFSLLPRRTLRRIGKGQIIIFVDRQEECDNLFADLLRASYDCLSLHGGKVRALLSEIPLLCDSLF